MPNSIPERLSALDASFLAVESPLAPMHVGWVASFDPPDGGPTTAEELIAHIAERLEHAHRYRQKLADVPLGVHDPVWVDDPDFDPARHLHVADGDVVDEVLSTPLPRDRPLWEMWVSGDPPTIVGKAHHCMVDGTRRGRARQPDARRRAGRARAGGRRLGAVARAEPRPAARPRHRRPDRRDRRPAGHAAAAGRRTSARSPGRRAWSSHTVLPPAPPSPLNLHGSGRRHHTRVTRSLDEVRTIRRAFGVTPNDVVLAACAGALHTFLDPHGPLKVMVPADVRSAGDSASGNRISFVFLELPVHEPDPLERLQAIHRATDQRRRDEEAERLDDAFGVLALTPKPLQRTLAHAFAHPRLYNLTISSVPGPAVTRYLRGCRLRTVHSAVPLSAHHGLSIGVVTVAGNACLGIYSDPATVPDADALAGHLDAAFDELLDLAADA